jgi:hypothetical protein
LLFTLPVISHRAYFTDNKHLNVCFHDAVIGTHRIGVKDSDVSAHIIQGLENKLRWSGGGNALTATCPSDPEKTVLILQRQNRKLLNAEALATMVRQKGLHATVAEFEGASVLQQISTARCCKLFIAVMGAGQQWVSFMRPGSTLFSIGWTNWNANYYAKYAKENNVKFVTVNTNDVHPNFDDPTIVKFFGKDKLKSESFRKSLVGHKQVAKYSDVNLSEKDLHSILRSVFKV